MWKIRREMHPYVFVKKFKDKFHFRYSILLVRENKNLFLNITKEVLKGLEEDKGEMDLIIEGNFLLTFFRYLFDKRQYVICNTLR